MIRNQPIWQRHIVLPPGVHTGLTALAALAGVVASVVRQDPGLWYLTVPGFVVAVIGIKYMSRHLGHPHALRLSRTLLLTWLAVALWWIFHNEVALGQGMLVFEVPMIVFARRALAKQSARAPSP